MTVNNEHLLTDLRLTLNRQEGIQEITIHYEPYGDMGQATEIIPNDIVKVRLLPTCRTDDMRERVSKLFIEKVRQSELRQVILVFDDKDGRIYDPQV